MGEVAVSNHPRGIEKVGEKEGEVGRGETQGEKKVLV